MNNLSAAIPLHVSQQELRILHLEDLVTDTELIRHELHRSDLVFTLQRVDTEKDFRQALSDFNPSLILADYTLPSFDGLEALTISQRMVPDVPFIFVTGTLGEELAIETLKSGATDYVLKLRLARLVPSVKRALREAQDRLVRKQAEQELEYSFEKLRALATHLQSVREEERTRIAREIHDELGQALTGLKFDLIWLGRHLSLTDPANIQLCQDKVRSMFGLIDTTIQLGRKIATELRPGILDDLGLVEALDWQAQEFQERTGIRCEFISLPEELELDNDRSTTLFRIFQETLTNVARHAKATQVRITLRVNAQEVQLEIQDNGRGITDQEINNSRSLGLLGMRERALVFGGEISLQGQAEKGTTVTVRLPR